LHPYIQAVVDDSPVAFWPCQDTASGLTEIIAGRDAAEAGTGTAITYQAAGPDILYGVEIPGDGRGFSVTDTSSGWASAASFTAEAWIYLDASFGTGQRWWIAKNASANLHEWLSVLYTGTYKVYSLVTNTFNTGYRENDAASGLTTTTWQHIAMTYDDATTTLKTYVDGVEKASATTGTGTRRSATNSPLFIGYWNNTSEAWKGRLSCVAYYDRALSSTEIGDHIAAMP
jgi:hypothetical protein